MRGQVDTCGPLCRLCLHLITTGQPCTTLRGATIHASTEHCGPLLARLRGKAAQQLDKLLKQK